MTKRPSWDTELYEGQHAFVWKYGEDLIRILDPKPGERILDLGCGTGQLTGKMAECGSDRLGCIPRNDRAGPAEFSKAAVYPA